MVQLLLLLLASTSRIHAEYCSICGNDKEVGNPDGVLPFDIIFGGPEPVTCHRMQAVGHSGVGKFAGDRST